MSTKTATASTVIALEALDSRQHLSATSFGPNLVTIDGISNGEWGMSYFLNATNGNDRLAIHFNTPETGPGERTLFAYVNKIGNGTYQTIRWDAGEEPASLNVNGQNGDDFFKVSTNGNLVLGENEYFRYRIGINAGPGNDRIELDSPVGYSDGNEGNDTMYGSWGDDNMRGGPGNDWMRGRAGDDYLSPGSGKNEVRGDAGNDRISYSFVPSWPNANDLDALRDTIVAGDGYDHIYIRYGDPADLVGAMTMFNTGTRLFSTESITFELSQKG